MFRVKTIVVAVAEALKISSVFPLAPAWAWRGARARGAGELGDARLVVRKSSAIGYSALSLEFLGRLLVESARPRDVRDFELDLFGDTWCGREIA